MSQHRLPLALLLRAAHRRPHLFFLPENITPKSSSSSSISTIDLLPLSRVSLFSSDGTLEVKEFGNNNNNATTNNKNTTTTSTTDPLHLRTIALDQPISKVFSGTKTGVLIDKTGSVFSFGENQEAQLGLGGNLGPVDSYHGGSQRAFVADPERVLFPEEVRVTSASLNRRHSLFLTSTGKVHSCGSSFDGALGLTDSVLGSTRFVPVSTSPALVEGLPDDDPVVSIGAGLSFSLALTASNKLYFFGRLGHGGVASVAATIDATRNGLKKRNSKTASSSSSSSSTSSVSSTVATTVHTEQSLFSPSPLLLASLDDALAGSTSSTTITNTTSNASVAQISCGLHHALISVNNRLFSFGLSRAGSGALGSGPISTTSSSLLHEIDLSSLLSKWGYLSSNSESPSSTDQVIRIDSISCGPFSSAFCANGHAFICGAISSPSLLGNVGSAAVNVIEGGEGGGGASLEGGGRRRGITSKTQSKSDLNLLLDLGLFFDEEQAAEIAHAQAQGGVSDARFKLPFISRIASELVKPSSSSVFSAQGVSSPRFVPILDTNVPFGGAQGISIDEARVLVKLSMSI